MSEQPNRVSRRSFLLLLVAVPAAVVGGFALVKRNAIRLVADKLRRNTSPYRLDPATGTGVLPAPDMDNIVRLAQALVPWRAGADTVAEMTREFVDGQCRFEPGALQAYLAASRLLDDAAGGAFAAQDEARRIAAVADIMPPPIRSRRDWRHVWNVFFRYDETRAAELVVGDILLNFYNDDRSWGYLGEQRG